MGLGGRGIGLVWETDSVAVKDFSLPGTIASQHVICCISAIRSLDGVFTTLRLIPAGAAFGRTIDASCVLWEEPCGSSQGACAIYDNLLLNRNVYFLILALKVASFCCFGMALFFLREPPPPPVSVAALPD
ncbi:hypothetical protein HPB49_021930 [Dermacentor silvarum]|uniref:Uncharacterized protein n=1 Tax=Dermacentor silvarum TaxID=543639 RepID=A0ACB8D0A0_DERSI|nr:hypothetical protein HPB49_021930 [Dermacentor silvarum]